MFFALSKILDHVVAPLTWGLVLIALAAFLRKPRQRMVALVAAFALLAICSSQPFSNWLLRGTELPAEKTYREDVTYDAVILLGGFVDGAPTLAAGTPEYNGSVERLLTTYDLLRTGHAKQAILSGGIVEKDLTEASVMARQLTSWGIDPSRLLLEDRSLNTRENAVDSAKIARDHGLKTLVLVTSAFHMPRAHGCFRAHDVALDVDTYPVDFRSYDPAQGTPSILPRAWALEETSAVLRERFGRLVYRVRGYTSDS